MSEKNSYILILLKRLAILCLLFSSNLLFANVDNAEVVADNADKMFESDVHDGQQNEGAPEVMASWYSNFIPSIFQNAKQTFSETNSGFSEQGTNAGNTPADMKQNYAITWAQIFGGGATGSQNSPSISNIPSVTIVMQGGNLTKMSGKKFIASTERERAKVRKNITQVNHEDNIRNVNLKLHSLYMSNIALSR